VIDYCIISEVIKEPSVLIYMIWLY